MMPRSPTPAEIETFRDAITRRLGLHFDDSKLDFLAEAMNRRLTESGTPDPARYLAQVEAAEELRALADLLSVTETYFFRYMDHFRAVAEAILPARIEARRADRRLRFLSAGCASGDEAYSLAILMRRCLGADLASWDTRIQAVDVSPAALQKARRARYSAWSLRETPPDIRRQFFRDEGRDAVLDRSIRDMVAFEERNLLDDDAAFWAPGQFDLVFCRNTTMYFASDVARLLIERISRALVPGGYLFLGHAETLRGISGDFHLVHTHDTFYYQRKSAEEIRGGPPVPEPAIQSKTPLLPPDLDSAWVDSIRRASERIASLVPDSSRPVKATAAADLTRSVELLRHERFSEAMAALPPEADSNADAQLLRAVILTNSGSLREAEEVCARVLKLDELNAGAHYLMALCREHDGNLPGAIRHDETAIYLDPKFAMPHLHRGMLARRYGDADTAARELGLAVDLLAREEASRVLLFGGGFSRESLIELCRTQARTGGNRP